MERGPSEALDPAQAEPLQIAAAQIGARKVELLLRWRSRSRPPPGPRRKRPRRKGRRRRGWRPSARASVAPRRLLVASAAPFRDAAGRRACRSRADRPAPLEDRPGNAALTLRSAAPTTRPGRRDGEAGGERRIGDERPATPQPIVGVGRPATKAPPQTRPAPVRPREVAPGTRPPSPTADVGYMPADCYGCAIYAAPPVPTWRSPERCVFSISEPASNAPSTPSVYRCLRLPNAGSSPLTCSGCASRCA